MAPRFAKLGVRTIREMLYFFPRRHMDYSHQRPISELDVGVEQTLVATVWEARQVNLGGRPGTEATRCDGTGSIRAVWFNQPYLAKRFRTNARIVLFGKVSLYRGNKVFESPEWELLESEELSACRHAGSRLPFDGGIVSPVGAAPGEGHCLRMGIPAGGSSARGCEEPLRADGIVRGHPAGAFPGFS